MALVFHRGLAMPLWAIAFFAVAVAAPPRPMPPIAVLLGVAVIALTMMAMIQWRRTVPVLVEARLERRADRAHAGIVMRVMTGGVRVRAVDRATSVAEKDDALDLVRRDDAGWQVARKPALPIALIPGAREPGRLTTFETSAAGVPIPDEPSTMDATTTAERQREGGGAPSQRRPAHQRSRWSLSRS
jgi:hypothetical protein